MFLSAKSWNLKDTSPAVSRSSLRSLLFLISLSFGTSAGRGCIWFSLGWRANRTSGGNGIVGREAALNRVLLPLVEASAWSHKNTCKRIGTLACRCNESFWLRETVSKHLTAPVEETIHGRTFWFDTLETTSSLEALTASL